MAMIVYYMVLIDDNEFYYLDPSGTAQPGDYVEVPFGWSNQRTVGRVMDAEPYEENEVPYPLDKMKRISRILTMEEARTLLGEDRYYRMEFGMEKNEDIQEAQMLLDADDLQGIMEWAMNHDTRFEGDPLSPEIAQKIMECYQRCAEAGNSDAALNLGSFYYEGIYVEQDYAMAASLYKTAADAGSEIAMRNLGYCYYYGRHQKADYEEAYRYFSLGALLGADANCFYKLGDHYMNGYGVEKNEQYGYRLYMQAMLIARDNPQYAFCRPDILMRCGRSMLRGQGTAVDLLAAHRFLSEALSQLYERHTRDGITLEGIRRTKELLIEAEMLLDNEVADLPQA